MPRLRLLAAILIAAGPGLAIAGSTDNIPTIRISADDGRNVSRVAFNFQPKGGFRVEQSQRQLTVVFPDSALNFAYDEVYPRREASRVLFAGPVARPGAAAFNLRFACDCETSVALDGDRRVLIEIRDQGSAAPPGGQAASGRTAKVTTGSAPPLPRHRPASRQARDATPSSQTAETDRNEPPRPAVLPESGGLAAHELERLRASLEWAASQGFMSVTSDSDTEAGPIAQPAAAPVADKEPSPDTTAGLAAEEPAPEEPASESERPGLAALPGAKDGSPVNHATGPMAATQAEAEDCTDRKAELAIDWQSAAPGDADYLTALGRRRAASIGQSGPSALQDMALFYLAHGLNREALATLEAISPVPEALRDAALILIGRGSEAGGVLLHAAACGPDAPVWKAALSKARGEPVMAAQAAANATGPLREFPQHPRTVLALDLADAALAVGDRELAGRFLDLVDPAPGQSVEDMVNLLRGRIALAAGHGERAGWYFAQALAGDGKARRRAQFALIHNALSNGEEPPAWAADVLRGALFDYRGDPNLAPIAIMAADLHAAMGDYAQALADLSSTLGRLPHTANPGALRTKAQAILEQALMQPERIDDAAALQLFQDHGHLLGNGRASEPVRIHLAGRMLAAGLPSAAEAILAPLAGRADPPAAILLPLAEAALRTNQPNEALALLSKPEAPDGAQAAGLKRRALIRLGQFDEAAAIAEGAGQQDVAARLAWAAADWSSAARTYAAVLSTAAAGPTAGDGDGMAAVRALAAAYMGNSASIPPPLRVKAMQMAETAGLADAAAALTAPALPAGLTLPDAVAAAVERSRQVRALFPARQPGRAQQPES